MKTQKQKIENKVVNKVATDRTENLVIAKGINLLGATEKNTKQVKKADAITEKQKEKNAKIEQREILKRTKSEKKQLSENITFDWLNDTQSKTALENWIKNNGEKVEPLLNKINTINNSSIKLNQVNKQLFKFGHIHELNKVDFDGNVIASKEFFNIKFMVTYDNSLLNRLAKYGNAQNDNFIKYSQKATENHLQSKYENKIKSFYSKFGKNDVDFLINHAIEKNAKVTRQQIIDLITKVLVDDNTNMFEQTNKKIKK
jgi:hypothetical protein